MNANKLNNMQTSNSDEFDLQIIFDLIIRNKLFISSLTLITTLLTIIFSLIQKPIYRGSFQIIIDSAETQANGFFSNTPQAFDFSKVLSTGNADKTQEYILKSSLVLKPVFNLAKIKYQERGEDSLNLRYKEWVDNYLSIEFEEGTKVLNIAYKDEDKDLIIMILNNIRDKYQDYSKEIKEKELQKTLKYFEEQEKNIGLKSKNSLTELNKFSIENGLGDIDGFVSLQTLEKDASSIADNFENNFGESDAGQRFQNQFKLLESYEAQYVDLSSKLKPNSLVLTSLSTKIENLKESLKRPNEILIKYRELTKNSNRNENLLIAIQKQLELTKLEIAKQRDPWELISEPTIDKNRVSPQRSRMVIIGFIGSTILSVLFAFLREKKTGIIYNFQSLIEKIDCNNLGTIYVKNNSLSIELLKSLLNKSDIDINKKILGLVSFSKENIDIANENSLKFVDIKNNESLEVCNKLIFIISLGEITNNDLILINQYIKIYKDKTIGWINLDVNTQFS